LVVLFMDSIKISLRKKWEPIEPFERALTKPQNKKKLGLGEEEYDVCEQFVHIVDYNGTPPKFVRLTLDEIQELKKDKVAFKNSETKFRTCFLWIIDENEKLKIARENIRNEKRF